MAYQDVKRAIIKNARAFKVEDAAAKQVLEQLAQDVNNLTQEVVDCHNRVLNFAVAIGNGLTTINVTLPAAMPDANYFVGVQMNFNNGGSWVTAKTVTGFTLTWATATVGAQAVRFLIVD